MKMNRVASFDVLRTLCMYLIVLMLFITIDTRDTILLKENIRHLVSGCYI